MANPDPIPNTRLTGSQTFNFTSTAQVFTDAVLTINRNITGGLNSLTSADTLTVSIDYSTDGGTTWRNIAGAAFVGGTITVKGNTFNTETLDVSGPQPFPIGTQFRVNTVASTPVRITGQVAYT